MHTMTSTPSTPANEPNEPNEPNVIVKLNVSQCDGVGTTATKRETSASVIPYGDEECEPRHHLIANPRETSARSPEPRSSTTQAMVCQACGEIMVISFEVNAEHISVCSPECGLAEVRRREKQGKFTHGEVLEALHEIAGIGTR